MPSEVIYEDLGLASLPRDAERVLKAVVEKSARDVEAQMKHLITARGFLDTGATKKPRCSSATTRPSLARRFKISRKVEILAL